MKKMRKIYEINLLLEKPAFTAKEAREKGVHPALLSYYMKIGKLRRLSRGIYQNIDYHNPSSTFQWEDVVEMVTTTPGAVICLMTALAIYDITDAIPKQHWIAIRHGTTLKRDRLIKVTRMSNMELGRTEISIDGIEVAIFDQERTIVDAFRLLSIETAIKALKMALAKVGSQLDLRKLQNYAQQLRFNITPYLLTATTI